MARKLNVGIVGMGQEGLSIYRSLRGIEHIQIAAVCDPENIQGMQVARLDGVETFLSISDFFKVNTDIIFETTGIDDIKKQIEQNKSQTAVIEAHGAILMEQLTVCNRLIEELQIRLNQISASSYTFDDLIGSHPEFQNALKLGRKAANSNSPILLTGESGTGKELFAHAIHGASLRRDKPFIKVDCAVASEILLESKIFGNQTEADSGTIKTQLGKLDLAAGGTFFVDEIGNLNFFLQGKLLKVLNEMQFERVGGTQTIQADVRLIAATNRNLLEMTKNGEFREDLYCHLKVIEICLPALRNHKEDIPAYVHSLITKFNKKYGKNVKGISTEAEEMLMKYNWPGNNRELRNVVERAMITEDEDIITHIQLLNPMGSLSSSPQQQAPEDLMSIEQMEKQLIRMALDRFGSSLEGKKQAAKVLKISLATLYNKLKIMN